MKGNYVLGFLKNIYVGKTLCRHDIIGRSIKERIDMFKRLYKFKTCYIEDREIKTEEKGTNTSHIYDTY